MHRLDQARSLNPQDKPWILSDDQQQLQTPSEKGAGAFHSDEQYSALYLELRRRLVDHSFEAGLAVCRT